MKIRGFASLAAAVFLLLPGTARPAGEPEAAYAKYHRAAASGDLEEMLRYGLESRRAEVAAMSPAQKQALVKMLAVQMPRAFLLRNKTLNPDGRGARLIVSGPGEPQPGEMPPLLYGTIRMVVEGGEWKVAGSNWSSEPPANLAPLRAGGAPAAQKPAPAQKALGAPVVGSMQAGSERKLGVAKEPCVYKPVMTAEDVERCR